MINPEFQSEPSVSSSLKPIERSVSAYRRAIPASGKPVYDKIAEALYGLPEISVRTIGARTPIVQLLKRNDARILLDRAVESEEELRERLFDSVPSLKHDLTIKFDYVRTLPPNRKGERFIIAKPSTRGAGPLLAERMTLFTLLDPILVSTTDTMPRRRTPDMTVIYAGSKATEQAIRQAEEVVRGYTPFYAQLDVANIEVSHVS